MIKTNNNLNDLHFNRFVEGDRTVFEKIFKLNYNKLVGFCNHFIRDADKAQSLAQESFVHLWVNREKIQSFNGIKSFLYTHSKSQCLNYIRHERVENRYKDKELQRKEDKLDSEVLESLDFLSMEFLELEKAIGNSISELPERSRQIFMMSRYEEKKNREIAEELNISIKAVEANITRALKMLKTDLSRFFSISFLAAILENLL